ncbi:MAG: hypothetical protein DMF89_26595 [Acidobacteria bacterium]|nr:MAG: hypothetical protein DMF89_26595 [Acidobacteriota bacterium]
MIRSRRALDDLDEEIRDHIERETQDNIARGLSPEAAWQAAHRKFGNVTLVKEDARAVWVPVWIDQLRQDVQYAVRGLRRNPGFTVVAVLTLALSIGANTAIFSVVDGTLLKPLPYPEASRIVRVLEKRPQGSRASVSPLNYLDWRGANTVFEDLVAVTGEYFVTLSGDAVPVKLLEIRATSRYFAVLGAQAALGRTFGVDDDQPGREHVVVLSHALWTSQFGANPTLIGQAIRLDGTPYTVIGVMPAGTTFDRSHAQIWAPLAVQSEDLTRDFRRLITLAKLKPNVTLEQAQTQMDAIGARLARDYPDSNKGWGVVVERYGEILVGDQLRQSLHVLFGATWLVLLIGCANLANVTLARGLAREREVTLRVALGAGQRRLIQQFLTESVVLSAGGGLLGVVVGYLMLAVLKAVMPPYSIPPETTITMDGRVLLFTAVVSSFSGLLFGLAPAVGATRPTLATSIREGGGHGASAGRAHRGIRRALIVLEVALTFVLLTGAGLLIHSFFRMQQFDIGVDSTNVLTAQLPISEKRFSSPTALNNHLRHIVSAVESLPGVRQLRSPPRFPCKGSADTRCRFGLRISRC